MKINRSRVAAGRSGLSTTLELHRIPFYKPRKLLTSLTERRRGDSLTPRHKEWIEEEETPLMSYATLDLHIEIMKLEKSLFFLLEQYELSGTTTKSIKQLFDRFANSIRQKPLLARHNLSMGDAALPKTVQFSSTTLLLALANVETRLEKLHNYLSESKDNSGKRLMKGTINGRPLKQSLVVLPKEQHVNLDKLRDKVKESQAAFDYAQMEVRKLLEIASDYGRDSTSDFIKRHHSVEMIGKPLLNDSNSHSRSVSEQDAAKEEINRLSQLVQTLETELKEAYTADEFATLMLENEELKNEVHKLLIVNEIKRKREEELEQKVWDLQSDYAKVIIR